jgi:type VI protein secretion system component VasF
MDAHNEQQGGAMARTRKQILAELRQAATELDAGLDETRATLALEMVESILDKITHEHAEFRTEFEDLREAASEAISLVRDLAVAQYSGEVQGARERRAVLVKHGLIKE